MGHHRHGPRRYGIVGTLAGFSVGGSIFIANLSLARESDAFESLMAMFLVAFLIFISSAIQFGTTPNLDDAPDDTYRTIQDYSYLLANASLYLGLCLSWLGLPLLLLAVGLDYLGEIFSWLVLFAIVGGALRIASSGLNILARVEYKSSVALPLICFALAAGYYAFGDSIDDLRPAEHGPALFAVWCFAVAAFGFSLQSTMVGSLRSAASAEMTVKYGRTLLVLISTATFTTTALLWFAVKSEL